MKTRDRRKTAFACEVGSFEWRRMSFGLCNASATFQRLITRTLQRIQQRLRSVVIPYTDDIVIATETIENRLVRIKEVFECLRGQVLKCEPRIVISYAQKQIPGTSSFSRRHKTRPGNDQQDWRLDAFEKQRRVAKLLRIC